MVRRQNSEQPVKLVIPKRVTITLDDDVHTLVNASVARTDWFEWESEDQLVNASLRKSLLPFALNLLAGKLKRSKG